MPEVMSRPVLIVGAGRHGRNIADAVLWSGGAVFGFADDTRQRGSLVDRIAVLGGFDMICEPDLLARVAVHVAIGNSIHRKRVSEDVAARGGVLASVIHPSAVISPHARLGAGIYVAPYVRISPEARLGTGCLIDPFCTIGGGSDLGDFTMLAAHCSLVADSKIGAGTFLGTHVSVTGVSVGANCIIGAGSVVLRDLPDGVRAFGTPAKVVGPADWSRPPV
jgi:sugar O-acyltransferase (sialic acid O-acetyltransferase NeuD family)